jgi:hypothetical protein
MVLKEPKDIYQICVYIKNDEVLEQARELLVKKNQDIADDGTFSCTKPKANWLQKYPNDDRWFLGYKSVFEQITLTELNELL